MTGTNQPIRIRERGLTLKIFANETEHGTRYATEFCRSYRDTDGNWQRTHVMRERDQLVVASLATRAHQFIQEMKQGDASKARAEADFEAASAPEPADA